MSENNEKLKPRTYIKNGKYFFNIIKIIPHSPTNIEKIGITIYKKTLEINILNRDSIDLILNTNSNFIESKAELGFINIKGIICFFYVTNNDIKEKEKFTTGNNKHPYKLYKIYNLHCLIISYSIPSKQKKIIKQEFDKIGKYFISEELFFCRHPNRFDLDIPSQLKVFEDNCLKYKLYENFMYNAEFSPKNCRKFLTPIVKGFYKHITYNNLFNDKDNINVSIKFKIYQNTKYLIEVEMFITPTTNQKYFQNLFYIYYNESEDKISFLNNIIDNWNKYFNTINLYNDEQNNCKNEVLVINIFNDKIDALKCHKNLNKCKNIDFINIQNSKEDNIENILNVNIEKLKKVGYNYKYNNIDYNSQNKLLILMICDLSLFSLSKILVHMLYGIFLSDRGIQKNVINNSKEEIIKEFKIFEKKFQKFNKTYPQRLNLDIIKDENDLKTILEYNEQLQEKKSLNFSINNKDFIMIDSEKKEDNNFVIVDSIENYDKKNDENDNNNASKISNDNNNDIMNNDDNINNDNNNYESNNIISENNNIKEKNNSDDESLKNININQINNENKNNIIEDNNNNNNLYEQKDEIKNENLLNDKNKISIFIGTFNVNALESDLIKNMDLDKFLFPDEINYYFISGNLPTFYCIGLEEIIELNPKNVLIKPKNKAELWEERISEELQKKYNYFLQCKEQLVGILLLFFVKSSEIRNINNIHIEKLKSGFMGSGNKGCCFFEFKYKNLSYGFCSCHLPAGQNKKNFLDRKELIKHILDFKVNKNINEFYKNDFFFIFGDLNFRTKKFGLVDLQNHVKIISSENKIVKNGKKKKNFRFSLDILIKKKDKKNKEKNGENSNIDNTFDEKINEKEKNISNKTMNEFDYNKKKDKEKNKSKDKIKEKEKENEKDIKSDYSNYYTNTNKGNEKKCSMDENVFVQYFFNEFLEDEELKKLKENELDTYEVDEAEITFPPTYKYVKGTNFYNLSKRVPSWTDRILYKKGHRITPIFYNRICINISDHKPIVGLYEIDIEDQKEII